MAETSTRLDDCAIGLSSLCIVHCLAPPLLIALAPTLTVWSEQEWLHRLFVLAALSISGYAMWSSLALREGGAFSALASAGLALLIAGAFIEPWHDFEIQLTLAGAGTLASAHGWRWLHRHRQGRIQ